MRLGFLLGVLAFMQSYCLPQAGPGAKQISLAHADVALSNDVFSAFNNPAGIAQMNWHEVGLYYSPAPFGIKEMANAYAVYARPLFTGSAAFGGMSYGYSLYRENRFLAAYSYNHNNIFFAGASVNYHSVSIARYGFDYALYLNAGVLYYISEEIAWGGYCTNINSATFGSEEGQIPAVYNTGLAFSILANVKVMAAVEKESNFPFSFSCGIDCEIVKYLSVRTGYSNNPVSFCAGLGINYSFVSLDYAFFNHQDLGLTHQAGIIISFKDDESRFDSIRNYLLMNK